MLMGDLKLTPLYEAHLKAGGKIVDYVGWALPVQYGGIATEHHAVRTGAGLFDVTHMGEIEVKGAQATELLQYILTNDISVLVDDQALYTMMCYHNGGVVDDLLVYRFNGNHYYLVVNAGNIDKDYSWMREHAVSFDVKVENISDNVAEVAFQGPKAEEVLQSLTDEDLSTIKFFHCRQEVNINGISCLISRTGYTGEDGFEIFTSYEDIEAIWDSILTAGEYCDVRPCGLGCRDTLRFEAALPLYGNEISEDITPLEAGLGPFIKLDKMDFIGKASLEKQKLAGLERKIVGIELLDKGIARHGYEILSKGEIIGHITTGYLSLTVGKSLAMALIDSAHAKIGNELEVKIRDKVARCKVISKKFYAKNYKK